MRDILSSLDRQRAVERAGLVACLLLGLVALWLLVQLAWAMLPRGQAVLDTPPARMADNNAGSRALSVSKWHLFGAASRPRSSGINAPATTLSMALRGTLADKNPKTGIAIIADEKGNERAWRAGDSLASGVQLAEVYPDHVVLVHDGVEEVMRLPRDLTHSAVAKSAASSSNGINPITGKPRNGAPRDGTSGFGAMKTYTPPEMAHGAVNWQQTVQKLRSGDTGGLADKLQVVPVLDNGKLRGVRLSATGDATLITKLGLRPDDVVTAVNGVPIDDIAHSQQAIEGLRKAGSARVTVLRNGKPTDIEVSLK